MEKKGEITSQQIVMLVIVIASFAVLLFFFFRLNLGNTTEEELCHNSVLTRGSAVVPTDAVPLNCHRQYVCITKAGGSCEGLTNPKRIEVNSLNETYKALAEQMANCWWMFGEGRVNYVGDDLKKNYYCSICSQIYFDKSLKSITGEEIDKNELYNYLRSNKIDNKNTYAEYLFGSTDVESIKSENLKQTGVGSFGNIQIDNPYFVVTGIMSQAGFLQWGGIAGTVGAVVGAAFFASNPIGWVVGAIVIGSAGGAIGSAGAGAYNVVESTDPEIVAISIDGRGIDNKFMVPTIIEANSVKFNALNCEEILTLA
jgi:hypothetical protein